MIDCSDIGVELLLAQKTPEELARMVIEMQCALQDRDETIEVLNYQRIAAENRYADLQFIEE